MAFAGRLSENEEMEERPSNTIDWQEIIAAIEGTQLESPGKLTLSPISHNQTANSTHKKTKSNRRPS